MNPLFALIIVTLLSNGLAVEVRQPFDERADCESALAEELARNPDVNASCQPWTAEPWQTLVTFAAAAPTPPVLPQPTACDSTPNVYDPADFTTVLEDFERISTLRLEGSEWDDTLVRNCKIHGTGGDGIFLKNVRNVVIQNCEVWNIPNKGIKLSSRGSTENITVDGNHVHHIASDGIAVGQVAANGVDHKNLKLLNNRIEETGLRDYAWATHPIYLQSQDALVEGNIITGPRDGNGISIRSSGVVRCNTVSGISRRKKPAIRYHSDHQTGASDTLLVERNTLTSETVGVHINRPVARKDGAPPPNHVVKSFVIRSNTIAAPVPIKVGDAYGSSIYSVTVEDNTTN